MTTTNLDAPLLRLMLSLASAQDTTWSSIDITSAFLNADIHEGDIILVTPPPILVKMNIVKPNTVWHVKKAIDGLREKHRVLGKENEISNWENYSSSTRKSLLCQSRVTFMGPSLWFIVQGPLAEHSWIPPFDHSLRSDEWTAKLHNHRILGYLGVYVDNLLITGHRSLNDKRSSKL